MVTENERTSSRRSFLKGVFSPVVGPLDSLRSGHPQSILPKKIDNFVEKGAGALLILAAVDLAIRGGKEKLFNYGLEGVSPLTQNPVRLNEVLNSLRQAVAGKDVLESALASMNNVWYEEYHKTRSELRPYSYMDCFDNCNLKVGVRLETEEYWEEPAEITAAGINSGVLSSWQKSLNNLNQRMNHLEQVTPKLSELTSGVDSYGVVTNEQDQSGYNIPRGVGYALAAGFFVFYEEFLSKVQTESGGIFEGLDEVRIKRREVLKLLFFGTAVNLVDSYRSSFTLANSQAGVILENQIKSTIAAVEDISDEQHIKDYFGMSIPETMSLVQRIGDTSSRAIEVGSDSIVGWDEIKPQLDETVRQVNNVKVIISDTFSYREEEGRITYKIPKDLVEAIKMVKVYDKLTKINTQVEDTPYIFGEILSFFGVLAVAAVGIEAVTKATDIPIDSLKRVIED